MASITINNLAKSCLPELGSACDVTPQPPNASGSSTEVSAAPLLACLPCSSGAVLPRALLLPPGVIWELTDSTNNSKSNPSPQQQLSDVVGAHVSKA